MAIDLTGQRINKLVVLGKTGTKKGNHVLWKCKCDCGNIVELTTGVLGPNRLACSKGCGQVSHGQTGTKLHTLWMALRGRATNKDNLDYAGRGIDLYPKWKDYETFRDYVLALPNCPKEVLNTTGPYLKRSIDRIDNDKGYRPGNIRWATRVQQNTNQRRTVKAKVRGLGELTLNQAAKHFGISYHVLTYRIRSGESPKEAVSRPARPLTKA